LAKREGWFTFAALDFGDRGAHGLGVGAVALVRQTRKLSKFAEF